jgi:hypothetical protein
VLSIRGAVAAALLAPCAIAPTALAHEGNPNYRSEVLAIEPRIDGLDAQVLNYDDRIELRNETGETVVVEGYRDEPYLRFLPDGTVQVNRRSPAAALNEDRFAQVSVPAGADPRVAPDWQVVAGNGRYDWHDHRIHWMSRTVPPRVRENDEARTKVFDWRIPVAVGGRGAVIRGSLTWLGRESGGLPLPAAISLGIAVAAGAGAVVAVRRRRRSAPCRRREVDAW